jgi:hypothetical protein
MYAQTPILDLVTPLPPICIGWSPAELSAGRRLVRFLKVKDGGRLIVSCESITQVRSRESNHPYDPATTGIRETRAGNDDDDAMSHRTRQRVVSSLVRFSFFFFFFFFY